MILRRAPNAKSIDWGSVGGDGVSSVAIWLMKGADPLVPRRSRPGSR
jgi:hypothetical protein